MKARLPAAVQTLAALFDHAADRHPDGDVCTFFAEDSLAFGRLRDGGRAVARGLLAAGVEPGLPVAILVRSNLEMLRAVAGIAAAGAVAVPLALSVGSRKTALARLRHVLEDSGLRWAVVDEAYAKLLAELLPRVRPLSLAALDGGVNRAPPGPAKLPPVDADDLALIQYTSGSTTAPKGVALTHRNVMAGIRAIHYGVEPREGDVLCHWLPLSHDMGLFSTLAAVGVGMDIRVSPPQDFVKHPDDWLRRAGTFGATILAGPNFFYRYLVDAIPGDQVAGYDLSTVRMMLNGAEPIDAELVHDFNRHFAPSGLRRQAMKPCYGLAEATLAVTFTPLERAARVDWVDRDALNREQRARTVGPEAPNARGIVDCGLPVPGLEIRITEGGRMLPERVVGDIEIRGEPVMRGYYRERSATVSPDGWCPTGDLGYLAEGCLHVTGRRKEMMILGGQNYYPQDVEDAVRQVPGVYKGNAVAVVLPADGEVGLLERIGVLAEVRDASSSLEATLSALRRVAAEQLGGAAVDVVLLRRNGLLRTTSGKFQRLLMRDQLVAGTLNRVLVRVTAGEPIPAPGAARELDEDRRAS